MRAALAILLFGAAFWQALQDWQATIGQGSAYRLTSITRALEAAWPEATARGLDAVQRTGIPYLWDPIGVTLLALPLALVLFALAVLLWFTRPRRRRAF